MIELTGKVKTVEMNQDRGDFKFEIVVTGETSVEVFEKLLDETKTIPRIENVTLKVRGIDVRLIFN